MVVDTSREPKTKATDDLAWRIESVCREHPTQLWFGASPRDIATAKALCGNCRVQSSCLEFALSRPELVGIWAATTPSERAVLRRVARTMSAEAMSAQAMSADAMTVAVMPAGNGDTDEPVAAHGEAIDVEPRTSRAPGGGWLPGEAGPPAPAEPDLAHITPDELLTPAEAARRLGVTPNTVTRWSRAGKISAIHTIGGHRRYRTSEIERVLRHFDPLQ